MPSFSHFIIAALLAVGTPASGSSLYPDFPYPEGVDVWCGKAYRATNSSFEPGGWLEDLTPSTSPLLNLGIRPRRNLYLPSDDYASFIVDAPISFYHGLPYYNTSFDKNSNITNPFTVLFVDIMEVESGTDLVSNRNVSINSTSNEFVFALNLLQPRFEPYEVVIYGASGDGAHFYAANTSLYYLPARTDGGSVVKLDNLYGSLQVQDYLSNSTTWETIFPFSYYVSWDRWLEKSLDNIAYFKSVGYNIIHIVPNEDLPNGAFEFDIFDKFLTLLDENELWLMYDMRWTYTNLTSVAEQVEIIYKHKSLLLWYTGDEPDGHTDPLNATKLTYDLIKSIDPYHPVSLCLNCKNFHYDEYSSGAEIILSDVYPIAVNTSWSTPYDTACNTTYGCCGCDDCSGKMEDISEQLGLFDHYDEILDQPHKVRWGVAQSFGNETFWSRYPSPEEVIAMNALSMNHGAKGLVMWAYPTEPGIRDATGALSKLLTGQIVTPFLTQTNVEMELSVSGLSRVDASAWTLNGQMLVSIVSLGYLKSDASVSVTLPASVQGSGSVLWGQGWTTESNGTVLSKTGIDSLEVDILLFDLA